MTPHVELIYDVDCPNVTEARTALRQAFARAELFPSWTERDRKARDSPTYVRGYGLPTILVNGKDVAGAEPAEGANCCRLYSRGEKGFRGVPSVEQIVAALTENRVEHVSARTMNETCAQNDLLHRNVKWFLWRVPAVFLILGSFMGPVLRVLLWTPALLIAGVACVINAARCGRLHCYITGPLYLSAAVATVLLGFEVVPLQWSWIAVWIVAGTILAFVPEWVRGKYAAYTHPLQEDMCEFRVKK